MTTSSFQQASMTVLFNSDKANNRYVSMSLHSRGVSEDEFQQQQKHKAQLKLEQQQKHKAQLKLDCI